MPIKEIRNLGAVERNWDMQAQFTELLEMWVWSPVGRAGLEGRPLGLRFTYRRLLPNIYFI